MRVWGLALALSIILLLPTGAAWNGELVLHAASITVPVDTTIEGEMRALYADAETTQLLTLTARSVRVYQMRMDLIPVVAGPLIIAPELDYDRIEYDLHNVQLTASGARTGWLAFYPTSSTSATQLAAPAEMTSTKLTLIGNGKTEEREPDPDLVGASIKVLGPHATTTQSGAIEVKGGGAIKLVGFDGSIVATENTSTFTTRIESRDAPNAPATDEWMMITFQDATLTIDAERATAAYGPATATWSGMAPVDGARWATDFTEDTSTLDGNLRATVNPVNVDGAPALELRVQGEWAPGISPQAATIVARPTFNPTFVLLPLLTTLTVGAVLAMQRMRREPAPRSVAVRLEAAARVLIRAGEDGIRHGRMEEAAAHYDEASVLTRHGEADLCAAYAAARCGHAEEARAYLQRALRKTPSLVVDAREIDELRPLL